MTLTTRSRSTGVAGRLLAGLPSSREDQTTCNYRSGEQDDQDEQATQPDSPPVSDDRLKEIEQWLAKSLKESPGDTPGEQDDAETPSPEQVKARARELLREAGPLKSVTDVAPTKKKPSPTL